MGLWSWVSRTLSPRSVYVGAWSERRGGRVFAAHRCSLVSNSPVIHKQKGNINCNMKQRPRPGARDLGCSQPPCSSARQTSRTTVSGWATCRQHLTVSRCFQLRCWELLCKHKRNKDVPSAAATIAVLQQVERGHQQHGREDSPSDPR